MITVKEPIHVLYMEYFSQKGASSPKSNIYYQTMSQLSRLENDLSSQLNEEGQTLLKRFCEIWGTIERIVSEETFFDGFQTGAQMILEVVNHKSY